ncbi:MAG: hypothetical protein K5945_04010 [Bacteroidaceae bacterium]|nr:hypothetical protein [Bacteroidaceae bacterium]
MSYTESNKRIARNSLYMSIRMVAVLLVTLYTTRVALSVLGVTDFGVYNAVCGFVSMFVFLNISMSNGIQRFYNFELGRNGVGSARDVYNMALLIQLVLVVLVVALTETLGLWYLHHKMVIPADRMGAAGWIFQFSILSFVFLILQVPYSAAIMAHEKMDYYAIVGVLDAVLKLAIALALPYATADRLVVYGVLLAMISVLNFFLFYVYAKRNFVEVRLRLRFDGGLFRRMVAFSGWNIFGSFSYMMKEQGINLVLNLFFGPVVNAARGVAAQVNAGLDSFVQNVAVPVRPQVVQSYAVGDTARTLSLTYSVSKLSCLLLYMLTLPIFYETDFILRLWLADKVPPHTATFLVITMSVSFLNSLNACVSAVVHASGRMRNYQVFTAMAVLLSVPLAYVVLRMGYSAEVALWMSFVAMLLAHTVSLIILKTIVDYSIVDYLKLILWPFALVVVATCWMPYIVHLCIQPGLLRFLLTGFVCVVGVGLSVYFIALNASERALVDGLWLKARGRLSGK